MKIHYINILLFALPLNILVYNQRYHKSTTQRHTPTNRSLCECELYTSANYVNDPQMKKVMENFNRQTSQRFHEYDNRMIEKRKQCKDQCDKEIQKIILKDKLEKQMEQQFTTLETKINGDDIPTCICEKSLADKTEKFCLNCGTNVGVAVPGLGVLGGYGSYELVQAAIAAGIKFATQEGIKAGTQAGIQAAIKGVIDKFALQTLGGKPLSVVITSKTYKDTQLIYGPIMDEYISMKGSGTLSSDSTFTFIEQACNYDQSKIIKFISGNAEVIAKNATKAAEQATEETTKMLTVQKTAEATSATTILSNPIVISFIVVVVIVILLLIIYLILRYRRKKKMKKKLQYIKLLEE
ncbi:rifin [Plasmodium reichenowi]|uniref:Rifin n=1 Tax=Plasmodium reichenowi TaxID=5854 RepID=A0A060RLX5_PLARE|nr:rifin [Plasmodium reichenowi]